ncbi:RAD51-associated protein 1-like [Pomacea canaliculata]|uniref:RAD51-associated protein 1-like n=1 Tax=Pomacea canaliculata TaxID=400727 RepID=UPI000D72A3ED|nr:RAD51-associated protein 1-like [Pomacea canaliculata]
MGERRSARSHKQVNYAKFDDELDDDFVDSTPPPSKKQKKIDIKECTQKEKKKDENVTSFHNAEMKKATANAKRVPVEEKVYERDLQAALELSLVNTQNNRECSPDHVHHSIPATEIAAKRLDDIQFKKMQSPVKSVSGTGVPDTDEIEFLGTVVCSANNSPQPRRQAAAMKDFNSADDSESSDEEDLSADEEYTSDCSDNDSDFDGGSSSKRKATDKSKTSSSLKKTVAKKSTPKISSKKSKKFGVDAQKQSVSNPVSEHLTSSTALSRSSASGSGNNPLSCRKPAWTPPGQSDGTKTPKSLALKSPSSGLRLGLSRHARIKPLHSSPVVSRS